MREVYALNKDWKFKRINEAADAEYDYFGIYGNDVKTGVSFGYNGDGYYDKNWETVDLPHDWDTYCEPEKQCQQIQGYKPQGIAWYRKSFLIPENANGRRVYLKFDAIAIHGEIYFNNIHVAHSGCGYVPTCVDVTDFIKPGERNIIAVETDNRIKEGWWYEGGGIYAPVYLIITENTHFEEDGVFVYSQKSVDNQWTLHVKSEIAGNLENVSLKTTIKEINKEVKTVVTSSLTTQEIIIDAPKLWDTENPKLYSVLVELYQDGVKIDEYSCEHGFRTVTFDKDRGCILNGKELKLKGTGNHHDHAGVGTAIPYELHVYRLQRLHDMGCNFIRVAHSPQNNGFYKACDKMGVLVMNENRHFASTEKALKELRTIVRRDRNHPCIILWSLFNEEHLQGTPIGEKMARTMKTLVNEEDGTRLIAGAVNGPLEKHGASKVLDVMGFNYFQYAYDFFHENVPDMPMIGSENASYMTNRAVLKTDSEKSKLCMNGSVQSENLYPWSANPGHSWKEVELRPFVAGCVYWTGFDYRGEVAPFLWPGITSSFGAMDLCGFPKDAFYWNKALWTDKPVAFLSPHWNFKEGEEVTVYCYSNCETLEFFLNGESLGEIDNDKYESASHTLKFVPGEFSVIGKNNGVEVCNSKMTTAKTGKTICLEPHKKNFDSGYGDVSVINISIVDEDGVRLPMADNRIYLEVTGGAKIIGIGNGDNAGREKEKGSDIALYGGYAQAIIQVDKEGEPVTFKASADGFDDVVLHMENTGTSEMERIESLSPELAFESWWVSDVVNYYPMAPVKDLWKIAWIPATSGQGKSIQMSGKNGWALMMSHFTYPEDLDKDACIVCPELLGDIDIYINEDKVYSSEGFKKNDIHIPIGRIPCKKGKVTVSVVFKLQGEDCGIYKEMKIAHTK